jgi:hypothetical protein
MWDENGFSRASSGNWACHSTITKKSSASSFEGDGTETIYWIIPGAMTLAEVEQKKILQSRFDSIRVVIAIFPMAYLAWLVVC